MKLSPEYLEILMEQALVEAAAAVAQGEVPVGAVVAINGEIIARAHNLVESLKDSSAHAEMLAMREAAKILGNWRLKDAVLCVTLEPCTMCIGAAKLARVPTVVYGVEDPKMGAVGSLYDLSLDSRSGPTPRVVRGIRAADCKAILSSFFEARRAEAAQPRVVH